MEEPAALASATILIVDDKPANLAALSHALAAQHVRILVAQQGESGLQIARRALPDLILLDVMLPGMDGFETCQRLKEDPATADIPVLFMTVRMEAADKLRGFQAGAVDYIIKPFQAEEVLARVSTHLRLRQLARSLQEHNAQLQAAEVALRAANEELERRVRARTTELWTANQVLQEQITKRQRVEEALVAERNLLRTLIDNLPDDIFVKDTQSRFVLANSASIRYLGVSSANELIGKTDFDFYPAEQAAQFYAEEQLVMQMDQPLINKEQVNQARGHSADRWVLTTKVPVRDAHGRIVGLVGTSRDITDRKHLEAQFLQAQKMEGIGRLAGGVAHDFNNLLTAIAGYAELAEGAMSPDDPARDDIHAILDTAQRATELTRQLLIFARKQVLEPKILTLSQVVRQLESLLRRLLGEDIELVTVLEPDLWPIKADATQIEQVLINLAINARDAMPHGGKLTIQVMNITLDMNYAHQHLAVAPGPYVMLTVSDTGTGIPPEVQARIFEPFFTTKEAGKGTGLGLATCYGIIAQHGGHIWVYSEMSQGTTFKVYLPRAVQEDEVRPASLPAALNLGGSETVLLVEDDANVRTLSARALRQRGYTVLEASNGVDALQAAETHTGPIDLLVADVIMPRLGGVALANQLAAIRPEMRVLFISGYADTIVDQPAGSNPGAIFLQKPFAPELLARTVREVLDAHGQRAD